MSYKVTKVSNAAVSRAEKFQTFEDLEVYKAACEFRKAMYAVSRCLPDFKKYDLGQIRRAAVSLTNNMAEGHGRYQNPDQIRFFLGSRGSLQELVDDLNVCDDEKYFQNDEVADLKEKAWRVLGLINGYLRYLPAIARRRIVPPFVKTTMTRWLFSKKHSATPRRFNDLTF